MDGLLKFLLHVIQRGLRVGGGLVLAVCFPDVPDDAVPVSYTHLDVYKRQV